MLQKKDNLSKISQVTGGRPFYDYVLMFKILTLHRYYNLSDEQVEFQAGCKSLTYRKIDGKKQRKSRIRSRVEHIFGFMENSMNGMCIQNIDIERVTEIIGLMNLTYNMSKKIQLMPI
jgi:hypothetical protein